MTARHAQAWRRWLVIGPAVLLLALGAASFARRVDAEQPRLGVTWVGHEDGPIAIAVDPGGAAHAAGLREGDRLVWVDGERVRNDLDLATLGWERGDVVRLTIERGGAPLDIAVTPRWTPRGEPYAYLALVGAAFLASALFVAWRWPLGRAGLLYPVLGLAFFANLTLSHTGRADAFDWIVYWVDVVAGAVLPAILVHLAFRVSRHATAIAAPAIAAAYTASGLLVAAGVWLSPAGRGGAYAFADSLAAIEARDRLEPLALTVALIAAVVLLIRGAARSSSVMRRGQMRWMVWGLVGGLGPFTVLYALPWSLGAPELPNWAQLLAVTPMLFLPASFTAALARYRLQDLDVLVLRGFTEVSAVFCAFAVYASTVFLLRNGLDQLLPLSRSATRYVGLLAMAVSYPQLREWVRIGVAKAFYRRRYSYRATLLDWARELNAETDLESLLRHLRIRVRETVGVVDADVLLRRDDGAGFEAHGGDPPASLTVTPEQMQALERGATIEFEDPPAGALDWVCHLVPMKVKGRVRAVLALSERQRREEPLNSEDRALLATLAAHAASAIEAARLVLEVRRRAEEIERLHARQETILETSAVGLVLLDEDGRVRGWNRALEGIYGLSRDDALGRELSGVFPLHVARRIERERAEAGTSDGTRIFRLSLVNRRGERIIANLSISPVDSGADRDGTAHVLTVDDVSKRVELEEQLLRQERLASLGLLAAGVAHEINTPLTGISSYTQMLLEEADADDPRRELLAKIEAQARRAASSTALLLNLARQERSSFEPVDVHETVREVVQLFEPQIRRSDVRLDVDVDRDLPEVAGHKGKLQQVLLNLLINARDAVGDAGTILIRGRAEDGGIVLDVADDGSGIAEEDLPRIFDPFFTTKGRGKGTGLGLSITYGIVQEHRGDISVESDPGRMTRFRVRLPSVGGRRAMA